MELILVLLFSYLCGSIPSGFILTKLFTNKDVRKIGSGNIGATNVLRVGNKYLAATTLFLDVIKGYIAVEVTNLYYPELIQISALMVFQSTSTDVSLLKVHKKSSQDCRP